jgi:replication initiation protein RepC
MLAVRDQADAFQGLPRGSAKPFRYLSAFQEAAPYMGLPPQADKLVAWLVKQTRAQDWEAGSRPIAWPSAANEAERLGLSPARVKVLNRALFEAGVVVIRDSETGKRYGRRGADGRIVEAYGFDLSPLAYRYDEFIRIAAEAKAERERMKALRRRATRARRAIWQTGETLAALDALPVAWPQFSADVAALVALICPACSAEDLELIVTSLENWKSQGETWVREASESLKTSPSGLADEPHIIDTNLNLNPTDYVGIFDEGSRGAEIEPCPVATVSAEAEPVEQVHPAELVELAPRLADYVPQSFPDWANIIDGVGRGLRHELGVSQSLWGDACLALGRPLAAVALAIVSTKPPEHFKRGAGGYFAGMVKRAKTGELHLDRSLWKLRRDRLDRIEREGQGRATRQNRSLLPNSENMIK